MLSLVRNSDNPSTANHVFFAFVLLCSVTIGACDDPSNVGLGLIDDEGGVPIHENLGASVAVETEHRHVTGAEAPFTGATSATVVGEVHDPLFGSLTARGHLDFRQPTTVPQRFRDASVTSVQLLLRRNYVYGDTTATIEVALHDMAEEWAAANARADTAFSPAEEFARFSLSVTDTLVTVDLPASWVEANDAVFRSSTENFRDEFHGFQFRAIGSGAVVGFIADQTMLRVATEGDTLNFPVSKVFSQLVRQGETALPADRKVVHGGIGKALQLGFDLDERLDGGVLNRVRLTVYPDTVSLDEGTNPNFVRPIPERLSLYGVTDNRGELLLHTANYDAPNGRYEFTGDALFGVMREVLMGVDRIEHFVVRVPDAPTTVNSILLFNEPTESSRPQLSLTVVPLD